MIFLSEYKSNIKKIPHIRYVVDLIKIILILIGIVHFIGISWYALTIIEENHFTVEQTWVVKYGIEETAPIFDRYIYSIYFAVVTVTTVGYGDITPANHIECLFLIFALLVSSSVYAFLINSIGNIMENIKMSEKLLMDDKDTIGEYMTENNIRGELRTRIKNYM